MQRLPIRRWFQFSFGTLLLIVAACGIWFSRVAYLARQQPEAIRLVESLGGKITFDHAYDGNAGPAWPPWLRSWLGEEYFRRIRGVALDSEGFTDDELAVLAALGDLKDLSFSSSRVTDEGVSKLRACDGLESLKIGWAGISDAAMADIGMLKSLKKLRLKNTRITDAGFRHLIDLPQLSNLLIGNYAPLNAQTLPEAFGKEGYSAPITDAALESIAKIMQRKFMQAYARLSPEERRRLRMCRQEAS